MAREEVNVPRPALALEVESIAVSYGGAVALTDVSITVESGQIVAIVGPNGAGKTTTLRAISGLVPKKRGSVRVWGEDVSCAPPDRIAKLGVAHVPEGRCILAPMSVVENLYLGAYTRRLRAGSSAMKTSIEEVFFLFPALASRREQRAGSLSGGEQQMLAIARALMSRPRVLLLDEPSLGLAPLMVDRIYESIARLNAEGLSILLVEQNAAAAMDLASTTYVLQTGSVARAGSSHELQRDSSIQDIFLGLGARSTNETYP